MSVIGIMTVCIVIIIYSDGLENENKVKRYISMVLWYAPSVSMVVYSCLTYNDTFLSHDGNAFVIPMVIWFLFSYFLHMHRKSVIEEHKNYLKKLKGVE